MGPGLNFETPEEIQNIQNAANNQTQTQEAEQVETVTNKRKVGEALTAEAWQHFTRGPVAKDKSYNAVCKYCGKIYKMGRKRGTGSINHHVDGGCKKMPRSVRHKPDALQRLLLAGDKSEPKLIAWEFDQKRSRKGLARMVIAHEYPFNCVNHWFLKAFLKDLQPSFKMISRNTLRADCLDIYAEEKVMLYDFLDKLTCRVSFTSDLWTNKGRDRGFMALTCHYIDDSWNLRKRVIAFCPLSSPHTGQHIAETINERLVEWNLDNKVFSLVLDNASSNDACINVLLNGPLKNSLPLQGNIFHQKCGCHILNLIVQDGLGVLVSEIDKVRETMKYIRHSQQRMEKFKMAARQANAPNKKPAWDVQTRWNSTYKMLELSLLLKDAINRYDTVDKNFTICPLESDWDNVESLVSYLKVFYDATLKLSGTKYPTLNMFFVEFCEVYMTIEKMTDSPKQFIADMGRVMFAKWDKYWSNGNILLALACVLDPRCKMTVVQYYFEMMYPEACEGFVVNLKACLNGLFKEYSDARGKMEQRKGGSSSKRGQPSSSASSSVNAIRAGLKDFIKGKKCAEPVKSEIDEYLADPLDDASLEEEFDILAWWKLKAPKYPVLAKLARDILAVPISTVASEATFSIGGRTLSPVRSSLNNESVEALICAQDWLKAKVTESGGVFGETLWDTDDEADVADDCIITA